ncbi:MAG TPA: family 10 glycosylhydrolase [Natronosporangium sp.]
MTRRLLTTVAALCGLMLASLGAAPSPAGAEPLPEQPLPEQWRSYWVDAFNQGIYTPEEVSKLVQDAVALNANALVVQTARRYDCFCNRALYPRTDAAIAPLPYDPLAEVIEQAHAAGLEVHAWVNVSTLWNSATPPSSPDHVYNQHGPSATGADRWLNQRVDGAEQIGNNTYLDPANPAAVNYIVRAIQSIVREYDVDGINLDYIRYPDFNSTTATSDWGYSEVSLARFQAATGRTDRPDPADPQFSDWRRAQITNLVRKIYLGMWEVNPQVRLSMDAITYGFGPQSVGGWQQTRTYAEVMQDWKGWLEGGFMDTVIAMNYKRNWLPDQAQMFSEWTEVIADWQGERQAVNGPALYLNSIEDSVAQVNEVLASGAAGWSGYSYANPSNAHVDGPIELRDAERAALTAALTGEGGPFAEPAAVPAMPWKANPAEGHVAGRLVLTDGTPLDQAQVSIRPLTGGPTQTLRTDGDGWFGFVHLDPGRYLVRAHLPAGVVGKPVAVVQVSAGEIAAPDLSPLIPIR